MKRSSVSSNFTSKLLNLENISPADNEIASLMDTTVHHAKPSSQTSSLHTVPIMKKVKQEPSKDSSSKEKKSSSTSKGTSQSQHKSSGKSAHAEEPSHTVDDSGVQHNQEFDMGHTDDQPNIEATPKRNCQVARAEDPPTSFDKLYNTPINFFAFFLNRLNITDLTQEILVGPVFNLLKGTCKSLTELEYHFEECSKATTKRRDWHNLEGKPLDLRKSTAYSAYSDPQGVIYVDENNKNRLMRTDDLHKFSDGTLDSVRTSLHDISSGIRMEYLPKKKWSRLDKRRARVMIQAIDKQLFQRRLMRNLEKFVGGREYGNDLRLLERII
ncbi:hypothetical protein Tco_0347729 [Tanacetum coccineum]